MSLTYYLATGSEQTGPLTIEELREKRIAVDTLIWTKGMADWARLDSVPELASHPHHPPHCLL